MSRFGGLLWGGFLGSSIYGQHQRMGILKTNEILNSGGLTKDALSTWVNDLPGVSNLTLEQVAPVVAQVWRDHHKGLSLWDKISRDPDYIPGDDVERAKKEAVRLLQAKFPNVLPQDGHLASPCSSADGFACKGQGACAPMSLVATPAADAACPQASDSCMPYVLTSNGGA